MTGSALAALDVVCPCESLNKGGGLGEGGRGIAPERRLADDGKRPYRRWTLHLVYLRSTKGGGLGEGRARDFAGARAGGFSKIAKNHWFFNVFCTFRGPKVHSFNLLDFS